VDIEIKIYQALALRRAVLQIYTQGKAKNPANTPTSVRREVGALLGRDASKDSWRTLALALFFYAEELRDASMEQGNG
jgi:hypothetical protein